MILEVVIGSQIVSYTFGDGSKHVYKQVKDVPMGLACTTQIANGLMLGIDRYLLRECRNNVVLSVTFNL